MIQQRISMFQCSPYIISTYNNARFPLNVTRIMVMVHIKTYEQILLIQSCHYYHAKVSTKYVMLVLIGAGMEGSTFKNKCLFPVRLTKNKPKSISFAISFNVIFMFQFFLLYTFTVHSSYIPYNLHSFPLPITFLITKYLSKI